MFPKMRGKDSSLGHDGVRSCREFVSMSELSWCCARGAESSILFGTKQRQVSERCSLACKKSKA